MSVAFNGILPFYSYGPNTCRYLDNASLERHTAYLIPAQSEAKFTQVQIKVRALFLTFSHQTTESYYERADVWI